MIFNRITIPLNTIFPLGQYSAFLCILLFPDPAFLTYLTKRSI